MDMVEGVEVLLNWTYLDQNFPSKADPLRIYPGSF